MFLVPYGGVYKHTARASPAQDFPIPSHFYLPHSVPQKQQKTMDSDDDHFDSWNVLVSRSPSPSNGLRIPDEPMREVEISLRHFNQLTTAIIQDEDNLYLPEYHNDSERIDSYILANLCGRVAREKEDARELTEREMETGNRRLILKPELGIPHVEHRGDCTITRDCDSVIGHCEDLPFAVPLALFPLARFEDTLKKTNHHKIPIYVEVSDSYHFICATGSWKKLVEYQGVWRKVDMYKIPNTAFGKLDTRGIVRLFLPGLYRVHGVRAIEQSILKTIYDKALRDIVIDLIPHAQARLPISHDEAIKLCRDRKGKLHIGSVEVPPHILPSLAERFLEALNKFAWGKHAFFGTEIRGTKGRTAHNPSNEQERIDIENEFLRFLVLQRINDNEWTIDIALEIFLPDCNMQWLRSGHKKIIQWLLRSLTSEQVSRMMNTERYTYHLSAGMTALSGFTLSPGRWGEADGILYINVYTTDKNVIYQLHTGLFSDRDPTDTYPSRLERLIKDVNSMTETMNVSENRQWGGAARVEIRVPVKGCRNAMTRMSSSVLRQTILAFPAEDIW